jgi:hypothetical protein
MKKYDLVLKHIHIHSIEKDLTAIFIPLALFKLFLIRLYCTVKRGNSGHFLFYFSFEFHAVF